MTPSPSESPLFPLFQGLGNGLVKLASTLTSPIWLLFAFRNHFTCKNVCYSLVIVVMSAG